MVVHFFTHYKRELAYGIAMGLLIWLLKWVEYTFVVLNHALELYVGAVALLFTGLGIWLALKLTKPKMLVVEKEVVVEKEIVIEKEVLVPVAAFVQNDALIEQLGISKRELEVLQLMARGLSNQQVADSLFVSVNTVKTHSSKLFEKLDVSRRTQAIEKAKQLNIIN